MNIKRRRKLPVFLFAFLLFLGAGGVAAPAFATDYYVATTGSDANPGTLAAPFRTIAHGSQKMAGGDTLLIRGGTYNENMIHGVYGFTMPNGTSKSAMTRFAAYPGEQVIVKPPVRGKDEPNFVVWFSRRTEYVEIRGLVLDGSNIKINWTVWDMAYPVVKLDNSFEQGLSAKNNRLIGNEIRYGAGILGGGRWWQRNHRQLDSS